jgi:hypothetical protein
MGKGREAHLHPELGLAGEEGNIQALACTQA